MVVAFAWDVWGIKGSCSVNSIDSFALVIPLAAERVASATAGFGAI